MTYDRDLADRLRELLTAEPDVVEKTMFGGLAFLVGGNLTVAASGRGGLMVRVDPERADELLTRPHTEPIIMRGRPTRGWLHVNPVVDDDLPTWVEEARAYVRTLPAKRAGR